MRDIRITVRGEDFAAVSEKLIALGVTFQVEPVGDEAEAGTARAQSPARAGTTKKKPAKKQAAERSPGPNTSGAAEAAARLRAMAERNRAAGGRPAEEPDESTRPPDTES
jgi:hypothetical protein